MTLRIRVAEGRFAPVAAFPGRVASVARHDGRLLYESGRWLAQSREHTNFTYDLTARNQVHLAWWVASVTGCGVSAARGYMRELEEDDGLRHHIASASAASSRRGLADREVRYGRRLGWYALVRALGPQRVVETGTDKGVGSCVLAAALLRNGSGRLTTVDVNPASGYLVSDRYAAVVDRVLEDSVTAVAKVGSVDVFLHDSLHSADHETAELAAVGPHLTGAAVVLSDNSHGTDALAEWAERTRRRFSFFAEQPARHWYPGAGIGASW